METADTGTRRWSRAASWFWPIAICLPLATAVILSLGEVAPRLHNQISLGWVCVLALAFLAFSGGYLASERSIESRSLALISLTASIFVVGVLSAYATTDEASATIAQLTWWSVPMTVALWTGIAVRIADRTSRAGEGVPAVTGTRLSGLYERWVGRSRTSNGLLLAILALWTIAFAAYGSVPGHVRSEPELVGGEEWRGYASDPEVAYDWFAGSALVLLTLVALLLHISHRLRPADLTFEFERRSSYASTAGKVIVLIVVAAAFSAYGVVVEPFVDLALALYAFAFAIVIVSASTAKRFPLARALRLPSVWRRTVAGLITVGFALALCVATSAEPLHAGALAFLIAGALPLARPYWFAIYGYDRPRGGPIDRTKPDTRLLGHGAQGNALFARLAYGDTSVRVPANALLETRAALLELSRIARGRSNDQAHPLRQVLYGLKEGGIGSDTREWGVPQEVQEQLDRLFPALKPTQMRRFNDLLRETVESLPPDEDDEPVNRRKPNDPGPMAMMNAECLARHPPEGMDEADVKAARDKRGFWLSGQARYWGEELTGTPAPTRDDLRDRRRASRLNAAGRKILETWLSRV